MSDDTDPNCSCKFPFSSQTVTTRSYGENIKFFKSQPKLIQYSQFRNEPNKLRVNFLISSSKKAWNMKRFCQHSAFLKLVKIKILKRVSGRFQSRLGRTL